MDDDATRIIFDPNSVLPTNHMQYLFGSWASILPSHVSEPLDYISRLQVHTVSHHKLLASPEHEFLVIDTVNHLDMPYRFILERRQSKTRAGVETPVFEPATDRTGLIDKVRKKLHAITDRITPNESHLGSVEEGSSSSSSPPFSSDQLPIGDQATLSLIYSSDLMSDSLETSAPFLAVDRFLGQNHFSFSQFHGQIMGYFKPRQLSLLNLVVLAQVVHAQHPTYTLLREQCFFYARLVYVAIGDIFGISPSQSADENQDVVLDIDSHLTMTPRIGRWKGLLVNVVDADTVSKIKDPYTSAYREQVQKVFLFMYL
jgi:hypothetical protein